MENKENNENWEKTETRTLKVIAHIRSDFPEKFGIPRQSGLVKESKAQIILEKPYRIREAFRGLEGYSHIWLLWEFSESICENWSPTVRPPRLGGNKRMGVFSTRSPYRPNPIGLSSVRLDQIRWDEKWGPVLEISGADLLDGTPIYDIKPYLQTDCHPNAQCGFSDQFVDYRLEVHLSQELAQEIPSSLLPALIGVLEQDPRPSYQHDPDRSYGMRFADWEIHFQVKGDQLVVTDIQKSR
jgi:tRNA-Thr(GGU) m(6)t(6)A37 methyltransferase TsaA